MCKKLLFLTGFLWLCLLPAGIEAQSQLKRLVFCQLGQGPCAMGGACRIFIFGRPWDPLGQDRSRNRLEKVPRRDYQCGYPLDQCAYR